MIGTVILYLCSELLNAKAWLFNGNKHGSSNIIMLSHGKVAAVAMHIGYAHHVNIVKHIVHQSRQHVSRLRSTPKEIHNIVFRFS